MILFLLTFLIQIYFDFRLSQSQSPPPGPFARHPSLNQGLGEVKQEEGSLAPALGHHRIGRHHLGQHIGHHHSQLVDLPLSIIELPKMTPEKGLNYHCNRTPTPTPWHFEESVEKVEEGVKVETWFFNGQGSYLDTQVDLSDQGASDVTLPSKKKRRRVLFSKVGLPRYHGISFLKVGPDSYL